MAVGTGMGLDVSKLDKELDRLDKKLDALIKKGEKTEKAFVTMFKGASAKNLLDHLDKVQSKISDISKLKDPMKWDSKSLVGYIDQVNKLLRTIEKANTAQGSAPIKIVNMEDLMAAKKELQTMLREVKALEKAQAQRTTSRNQTYAGAMRYSANANTLEKERQAIENLKVARDKLKQSDADYATKLNALNEAIRRHEKSIKDATKTDKDRADEAAKNAKKIADAQAKYDSISRRERYKSYTTSYEGAIRTSDRAKTLAQEIQAVKNLEAARAKLNKTDADYQKKLDDINARILQHNKNIAQATAGAKGLQKAHSKLGTTIASVFSIQAIRGFINQMIKVRGEMELQQRSLQAILQNKDAANEIWQKTIDLAVRSPFRIKELVTYTKQLAAYRVEADKLYETNKMLADVSAGLGVDMQRLILAFGQVKAANFLRGTELRQFTEAGIPMLDELAKHFNDMNNTALTSADVFAMISKRMVLFEDVEAVFERLTKAGGTFYRMQEIQAETLKGQISNLKDSVDIMLNSMGKDMDGVLKKSVKSVKFLVDNYHALIPVLKAIIAALALYKVNSFAASEATLRMARSMKMAKISAIGLGGAWTSLRVGLAQFRKALGKTIMMLASNPWLLLATAIMAATAKILEFRKELKEVDKTYRDMLNQQSEITAKFFKAEDIDERKKALKDLIEYAEKEYSIKVSLDLKDMSDSDVTDAMNRLRQQMIKANAFGATFQKELLWANKETFWEDFGTRGIFEQGLNKDIEQMGESYDNLNRIMVNNLAPTIDLLSTKLADLNEDQRIALESLKAGIGEWEDEDEDIVDYFDRIRGNYETLIGLLSKSDNIADKKIARQLKKYQRRYNEAEKEFQTFIHRIDDDVAKLNAEDKAIFLSAAIDDAKSERNWSEFEETQIRKWLEKKYTIELTPKIVEEDKELKAWQDSYNNLFEGMSGWRKIRTKGTSQTQVIEQLNAQYKATEELVKRIQQAGEDSILEGGAYEGENLEKLKKDLAEIKAQLDWFGARAKGDDDKEKASVKILQRRINLLKEVNKKYLELEKTFDAVTAKEKVIKAYSDTFREAFAGTGVDLDLYKVMTKTIMDASEVGSEAGSSLTKGMLEKLKGLESAGTYIRSFSDDLVEEIKKAEGFRAKAYQDAGGIWTQGYGETQGIEKNKAWTEEFAAQRLQTRLTEDYAAAVNKVLDANKDLIVTQEQYNALVDLAYQGGGGAVKNLVNYAKNIEQGSSYIERISKKIKETMGEEAAARFGETFVSSFKKAETIQERMALLLQTMNLTIKGKINKDWYEGMQARSDKRAAMFSGDLDIANQLESVLVRIAGMDFTTTEGMVEALGKLKEIAQKEGPEAQKILSQVISGFEAEIGLRIQKDANKKLNKEIEDLFDQYELTLDLKKLNLSKGLAEELFNTEYLDLEGLRKAVTDRASEFIGTEQEEEYKKFLEKIDDMERKAIVERTKTYAEYLKRGMNDRIKLKVEELRRLKELEESKEFTPDQKKEIRAQIQADSSKALDKARWEQFQGTELYTMMFEDLETLGTQSIENLYDHLEKLKLNLSHLDASEVKEIVNQMEKLQEEMISRNPFKAFRIARKDIKTVGEDEQTLIDRLFSKEKIEAEAQAMIDSISTIERAIADGTYYQLRDDDRYLFRSLTPRFEKGENLASIKKDYQDILDSAKRGKELTADQLKNFADYRKSLQGISDYWGEMNGQIQNIVGSVKEIMGAFGADEISMALADSVGSMSTLITQAVQFGIQMQTVGYASNMALGVIGWIAIAIQAIATVISAIANVKNARIDAQLEEQAKLIERQRDLYEQIEEKVEKAYSSDQLRQYNKELERSVELEIQALEASIALEKSRKKADEEQIKKYEEEIADARKRLAESTQEMMEELGGIFDLTDFASGFVDAWWEAMDEGMNGLDALNEHFDEVMVDMVKKQALYAGASKIMEQLQNAINAGLEKDYAIDESEWDAIVAAAKKANIDLDAFLQGYRDLFGELSMSGGVGLSGLQKGIQGITSDQAEILSAYWNSVRGYTASIDSKMDLILANMGVGAENNPMLEQLISQTGYLNTIKETIRLASIDGGSTALNVRLVGQRF